MTDNVRGTTWSDGEIALIIAAYFAMLQLELAGDPFNKAARNRELQSLTGRSATSIERKHQNISAVLEKLGHVWIRGYKPLGNYQNALIDGIERYLSERQGVDLEGAVAPTTVITQPELLAIGDPPKPDPKEPPTTPALRRLIRKFDPAARDARNRLLGKRGEELVFHFERQQLRQHGREELAARVEWTAERLGDGAGYDIRSFNPDGTERLIEVKTTNGSALTPFYLSANELAFSEERPKEFRLMRLYDFGTLPRGFELTAPLREQVALAPTSYRASF